MADLVQYYGTGRRKTSVARVYLRPGSGDYKVNGRAFNEYFVTEAQRSSARQPLLSTETRCFGDERQIRDEFAGAAEIARRGNALQFL